MLSTGIPLVVGLILECVELPGIQLLMQVVKGKTSDTARHWIQVQRFGLIPPGEEQILKIGSSAAAAASAAPIQSSRTVIVIWMNDHFNGVDPISTTAQTVQRFNDRLSKLRRYSFVASNDHKSQLLKDWGDGIRIICGPIDLADLFDPAASVVSANTSMMAKKAGQSSAAATTPSIGSGGSSIPFVKRSFTEVAENVFHFLTAGPLANHAAAVRDFLIENEMDGEALKAALSSELRFYDDLKQATKRRVVKSTNYLQS